MKSKMNLIISYLLTSFMLIVFFVVDEYYIFHTPIGILVVLLFLITFYFSMIVITEYSVHQTNQIKEKRFYIFIPFYILVVMFFISQVYFYGEFYDNIMTVIILSIGEIVLFTIYMILSLVLDMVKMEEDSFTLSSLLQPKPVTIVYEEITAIKFGWLMNTIKVKTANKMAITDITLSNSYVLLNELYKRTSKEIHQDAFEDLGTFYKFLLLKKNLRYLDYYQDKIKD